MNFISLITYLRAGYPGLILVSPEEVRAEAEVAEACAELDRYLHAWSSTDGLVDIKESRASPCSDPLEALQLVEGIFSSDSPQVVLFRDFQPYFDQNDPLLVRRIKDLLRAAKSVGHVLILTGCRSKLPPELEHELTRIELALPDTQQLSAVLNGILGSGGDTYPADATREAVLQAALGLTTIEAENVFALSLVEAGTIDPKIVAREKASRLKSGGLLEVIEAGTGLDDIGGLDELKRWLSGRRRAFGTAARSYGLPAPKGLLIVGIPGTGKSLTAKAAAGALQLPLLRLDMGRVFGGIVGQSEANLRTVIQTTEAIAPCVLWIDEIEKGFAGSSSGGSTDGGTSSRVFGSFLSWMQEKQKPVFVVATANDVSQLPPEFLRKGRFDELFFVDLPDARERAHIWDIVIERHGRNPTDFDPVVLARASESFTGAEIEAAFIDALHTAFDNDREPTMADVGEAMGRIVPLAQLMDGKIAALRHWAQGRARGATNRHLPRKGCCIKTLN
ncbi:AAA+ superfamily predicted ATPase [Haloferula luteola]|uniref:Uncharacterized AAA domain-containing protein ycf46 n=1 Tax=Haloferula luteola TaxID=595692 RepID=A0A840VGY2_9BACT|nr:AAA family ATPase [Haloferula luteola]MBB5353848.1 AAA+ superfamily predicted ATPase [Haloferula luteola]